MNDPRKEYVVQCIISVLNIPRNDFRSNTTSNAALEKFLDDPEEKVLQAVESDNGQGGKRTVTLATGLSNYTEGCHEMHFIKTSYEQLTEENMTKHVMVSSIRVSPVRSLFYNLNQIFTPLCSQGAQSSLEGKLADHLSELDAGLKASFRRGMQLNKQFDEKDLSGIISPIDEVRFWDDWKNSPAGASDVNQDRAAKFSEALSPLASDLEDLTKKPFAQLLDLMEHLSDALDTLWQTDVHPPYPEKRMQHFLTVIAGAVGRSVQARLNSLNVWTSSFSQVSKHIREGHRVCEKWNEITVERTGDWRTAENQWQGETYSDAFLVNLAGRIQEVSQLRSLHDQILKILSEEELAMLQVEGCFEPFKKLSVFSYNEYTVPMWKNALAEYERNMAPVETKVAERLRAKLFTHTTSNPAQTVRVFQQNQELLERRNIREALTNERERLLTELGEFVERVLQELESFDPALLPTSRGLSIHARKMIWVEHLRAKADLASRPLVSFLRDLPSISKVKDDYKKVKQELKEVRQRAFKEWQSEVESQLNDTDNNISLEMNSRVMEFETAAAEQGALKITYSERLITLVKEARLFENMGCQIPNKVKTAVQNGLKFYRFAVQLKQICNFYNTLSNELLPSQKMMVLQPALAFEQLFSDKQSNMKKVQWGRLDQLEAFTRNVSDGAVRLRTVNSRLRNGHDLVTNEVVQFANISLLRQRDDWRKKLLKIQKIMDNTVETCSCNASDAKPWRAHWDYQIFKIMEVQYKFGLETLNENLTEMKAELVLQNRQLRLKPPIEDLRTQYYKEIRQFICWPLKFTGLEGAVHIYKLMSDRNQEGIAVVFQKADELFNKLLDVQSSLSPWLVLGMMQERAQEMVEQLQESKDWDLNFKALKAKRKEMDKIPDTIKVDCFTVSTVVLKNVVEDQMDRLNDSLTIALKRKVEAEVKAVMKFLDEGLDALDIRPDSVKELAQATAGAEELQAKLVELNAQLNSADDKNKMLRTVANPVDMNPVQNKFVEFQSRLEKFGQFAADRREELRSRIDARIQGANQDIEKFQSRWTSLKPKTAQNISITEAENNAQQMRVWQEEWQTLKEQIDTLCGDCADFGLNQPALTDVQSIEEDLNRQQVSWSIFEEFVTQMEELLKQTWLDFRPRLFTLLDLASEWMAKLKEVPRDNVTHLLSEKVQMLSTAHPILRCMTGECFEKEHWKIMFGILRLPGDVKEATLTFRMVEEKLDVILEKADELKELTARAIGEVTIREAVMEVFTWFEQTEFCLMDHPTKAGSVPLIKDWKDMMSSVSDKQNLCSSLKDSRFFGPFKDQVDKFEEKLALLDELLISMNKVQRKWVYLEPIFSRGALPHEKERFEKVNQQYRQIMKNVGLQKKVNYLCTVRGLKDQFVTLVDQLERCQRALNNFLEEKRSAFPRLYFIGDEDLLEILGQSSNPEVIQAHLKKLFAGIATVEFNDTITQITTMKSSLKEKVPLSRPVVVKSGEDPRNVEEWLSDLSNEMVTTLSGQLNSCYGQKELDMEYYEKYPSQLLCLCANIQFTQNIEKCIQSGQILQMKSDLQRQLQSMTSSTQDTALLQSKFKALILDLIHNIDVLDELLARQIAHKGEWCWFKQLRYYLKPGDKNSCRVRMLECEQLYSFEYQGNAAKLVHTPLTDKCYLTLMHGMHLGYGGNPYGPAGTGKTESVKALGSCMGRQVLVFNCDEGIDFQAMGRIFKGLVRCGAWGCFDEFNRLLEEQMSAISQSVQLIQAAIKNRYNTVALLGGDVEVNHNAGIFITLNPATKGYGGRQKLPDNLKQLFRPVAMSVPDNELIAEVMMFSEGFTSAKILAQKVVSLFLLSRQLLSPQQHYDWGLRALKPILTLAGRLLQEQKAAEERAVGDVEEAVLLLKAVRMNTLSKLTFADARRFQDLCQDLFPDVNVKDIEYKELEMVIREVLKEMKLSEIESQISKMLQFHEACQQRMGVGIVGPSGCGKSTIWKVLENSYKKQGKGFVVHVMNPKSMARVRLLGHMDHDTREWFDGVLTASARKVIKEDVTTHNWIICDGDVDPEWVESLNSVLDDNRLLTMPNGERIQFGTNVNFIFETDNLRFASPATISRLNMIFLSEEDVDIKPLVTSWIRKQPDDLQGKLESLFDEIFYRALDWVYKGGANSGQRPFNIETTRMGMVQNVLGHMRPSGGDEGPQQVSKAQFLLAVCRGLGGNLSEDDRTELTRFLFKTTNDVLPDPARPLNVQYLDGSLYAYQPSSMGAEVSLDALRNCGSLPPLIPTVSVLMQMDLFRTWLADEQPFIVCGPEGCGKNLLIRHAIFRMQSELEISCNVAVLHCNAQTSSKDVLQKLRQFCSVTTGTQGRMYRPKEGRRVILYMKDINLPTPDKYDTSEVIMFLQQCVMHNGFYDDDLEFVQLEHVQIIASVAPATTLGRHRVSTRFTAIVRVCSISYPSADELVEIYTQLMATALTNPNYQNVAPNAQRISGKVAEAMVEIYSTMKGRYTVDDHDHYLFSPRDLTQWVVQLLRYEVASVEEFLEAWAYEASRIFRDRLVGEEAQTQFDGLLKQEVMQHFNTDIEVEKLCYTSLLNMGDEGVPKGVMNKVSREDYKKMVEQGLKLYEREVKDLPIELVSEVIDQLAWVDRAFAAPIFNDLLIVGRAGGGRRSVVSLMANMHRLTVFSPAPGRRYGEKEWKRDLKQVMQMTGVEKQHTVFLLEDHHLLQSSFLESINSLLSAGDVPGIWTNEELEPLLAPLKEEFAASQGRGGTARTPFEYFVTQVRERLRIVLSMDATHPHFLPYCAANPALFSCTTVLWLEEWSQQSKAVIISRLVGEIATDKKSNLTPLLLYVHESQHAAGASPRHFITLLQTCKSMYQAKIESSSGQSTHLQKGLQKLQEVTTMVEQLKEDAVGKSKMLEEKNKLAQDALERITKAMEKSAQRRQEVEQLEESTRVEQEKNESEKVGIEKELAEIQPILDAAKKAVGSIKPDHLNEIRALKMPPEPIHDVLNGVLRLMGSQDSTWANMRKFLAGSGAIQRILNFDPRQISAEVREDVEKLLKEKATSFDHATIYRVSVAAAPLAKWVVACVRYSSVLVRVSPMEQKLGVATEQLKVAQQQLTEYKQQLLEIDKQVEQLRTEFNERTAEAQELRIDLQRASATLEKAQNMTSKMSEEAQRWGQQVREIQQDAELLSTHACFAAAYVTYLGHFPEDVRAQSNQKWTKKRSIDNFDFLHIMSSESELLTWKAEGLSADRLSQENAVMIKYGTMVPFIVDPNSQAIEWLKHHAQTAETCLQQDPKLVSQLELAVRFGKTLIIQEVDGIETYLFPLLRKDLMRQGPRQVVQIGDKMCDHNEGFHLFLCTRNSNAIDTLPPNASCLVTRVNFTVTRAGLEGQLLGVTLQHEKPELEQRKSELLQKEDALKVELADLEKRLLEQLADASGNILENEPLIKSLEGTKAAATTIKVSLAESDRLQADLDQERETYRPLATLGSRIFILVRELSHIDHMYRFSLESFMVLFDKTLNMKMSSSTVEDMLRQLGNQLKMKVLFHVSRSLFKADRLTFGLHMVRHIMPEKFEQNEWELFQGTFIPTTEMGLPPPAWCPAERAPALQILRAAFPRIDEAWQLTKDALWGPWASSDKCEESFDPSIFSRLSSFQRVLLTQAVRPDRLESALTQFTCEAMGVKSLSPPPLSLKGLHGDETTNRIPVLFVTTPGADPSLELEEFAKEYAQQSNPSMNFHQLAMGGGQNDDAIRLIQDAAKCGDWICLKNLHLVISWVPLLEKEIKNLQAHENFRCWLTTEAHAKFPPILLETSLKVTYEAPPGVKKNLLRTLESWNPGWFAGGPAVRSQVMFVCAHFHAIMQERRTYIPQGWTKFYEFSQGDLQSACETVSMLVKAAESMKSGAALDWVTLIGVLEFAVYGSRVDNDFDSRLVREYLSLFFKNEILDGPVKKGGLEIPAFDIPATTSMPDFRMRVDQLPDIDNPQSFGMAPNADRSLQRINSTRAIAMLRQLASSVGATEGGAQGGTQGSVDVKTWKPQLSPLWTLWESVSKNQLSKLRSIEARAVQPDDPPLVAFALMDAQEATRLEERVTGSLSTLQKVVNGSVLSTPDIQAEASCLMRAEVPPNWTVTWPSAPEDPTLFLQGLAKRIVALKSDWVKRVSSGSIVQLPVSLSDFLRPDVFLNALRQQTARRLKISIDSLHLVASFEPQLLSDSSTAPLPVTLQNLILEGCTFDDGRRILVEGTRTSPLTSVLPPLTIAWMSRAAHPDRAVSTARGVSIVAMPIYVSLSRERLIGEVCLHTDSARQRILNSAALFLTEGA
jgi:dynein heavy chain 2